MLHGLMMDYPLTLNTIVEHTRRMTPQKTIKTKLPDGSWHEYSYADFSRRVRQLGNVLETLGVQPGDRVATFAWNSFEHLELYFGIPCAGAVCHTLNIRLSHEQLITIIDHAEDKVIFVDGTLLPLIEPIAEQLGTVEHFVLFNVDKNREHNLLNASHYEDLMAAASDDYQWRCADENMAMGLCYTSGTTGMPKGVLYSHRSMMLHTLGVLQAAALGPTEGRCRVAGRAAVPRHGLGIALRLRLGGRDPDHARSAPPTGATGGHDFQRTRYHRRRCAHYLERALS